MIWKLANTLCWDLWSNWAEMVVNPQWGWDELQVSVCGTIIMKNKEIDAQKIFFGHTMMSEING